LKFSHFCPFATKGERAGFLFKSVLYRGVESVDQAAQQSTKVWKGEQGSQPFYLALRKKTTHEYSDLNADKVTAGSNICQISSTT
jgi:hypothetical protein